MLGRKANAFVRDELPVALPPGLRLVPARAAQRDRSPLVMWHLLSLDAPTVAAVWTLFIAYCCGLQLPWTAPAAMFVAVWMLYAADRLLDARPQTDGTVPLDLEERHRFHHRHRGGFLSAIAVASVALAALLHRLDARALHLYALLATLLAAWLLLIHARPQPTDTVRRLPKELAVGIFFPAAIFVPTVGRLPLQRLTLFPVALLFAAVCTLNCLFLYAWENGAPRSRAHWTTRWACEHLPALCLGGIVLAASFVVVRPHVPLSAPAAACALSMALLLGLHGLRDRMTPLRLRAAADFVLLTPLLLWMMR